MYYLLVISAYAFSSIIMTISLLDILVKTKHWNQFATDISGPVSMLMYNNSTSPMSLVYNPSHNVTSPMNLSNNSLFLNNHRIPFLQTSLRNFCYPSSLILSWSQLTSLPSRQSLFLPMTSSCLFVLYIFSKHGISFHVTSNRSSEFVSNFFCSLGTAFDIWLHFTSGYHSKGDGQTKCTSQTLKQYLCIYCNYQQDNWFKLLPLMEFAYNNALSATTGISPFFANRLIYYSEEQQNLS